MKDGVDTTKEAYNQHKGKLTQGSLLTYGNLSQVLALKMCQFGKNWKLDLLEIHYVYNWLHL